MQIAKCKLQIVGSPAQGSPARRYHALGQRPWSPLPIPQFAFCILQFAFCIFSWTCFAVAAQGDVLELGNGGRIEGRVVESADGDKAAYVVELSGGGRVSVPRSEVTRVDSSSDADAEYQKLARTSPDTVDAHWKLVEWCRERKMRDRAQQHLARILELDPNHKAARAALGFRQKDGQWVDRDDVMASRGLVRYEGRYVTPQHIEIMERQKELRLTQADWANTLERLRRALTGRRQNRADEALAEIQKISDPLAAEALVATLRREELPELKRLWIDVAARLDHQLAVDALVDLSLTDPDPEIRLECLELLIKSGRTGLVTPYIRALKHRDNEIVNRAGAALGQIGDTDAMGPLIDALVTRHTFKISEANPDQHAYSFSPDGSAFSFGGSGPRSVTEDIRNPAVLGALVNLAGGASFDYDQDQWRRWLAAQAKLHAVDVRRDQ